MSVTTYLIEELGDARLRCDQLVRYISEAVRLIDKSPKKDHFFEVAGHLIEGIPVAAFKLEKSLQAVALAAGKLDYEELKQELRPEKVQQLEKVLEEVRIRPVHRRSEPQDPAFSGTEPIMDVQQAIEALQKLAQQTRESGNFPTVEALGIISDLETGLKVASESEDPAMVLDRIASALSAATPGQRLSRGRLAGLLRKVAAEEMVREALSEEPLVKEGAEEMLPPEALVEEMLSTMKAVARSAGVGRWRVALLHLTGIVEGISNLLAQMGDEGALVKTKALVRDVMQTARMAQRMRPEDAVLAGDKTSAADRMILETLSNAYDTGLASTGSLEEEAESEKRKAIKEVVDILKMERRFLSGPGARAFFINLSSSLWEVAYWMGVSNRSREGRTVVAGDKTAADPLRAMERMVDTMEDQLKEMKHSLGLLKRDPGRNAPQQDNFSSAVNSVMSVGRMVQRSLGKTASEEDEEKQSRFEEGKPADPTRNMDKDDAAKWKSNTEEYGDKFKKEAVNGDPADLAHDILEEGVKHPALQEISKAWVRVEKAVAKSAVEHHNLHKFGVGSTEDVTLVNAHIVPALKSYVGTVDLVADQITDRLKRRTASEDEEKEARFEEGRPADPTENMSPEDAKKWKVEHEKNKDNFKAAAARGRDPVWIKAKYPGKTKDGTPFKKGERVLYFPNTKTFLVGSEAEKAYREFSSQIADEAVYNFKGASDPWKVEAAEDEEKEARFEEGKPADPTEEMSPEDAKKWKSNTEEYGDKFKKEAKAPKWDKSKVKRWMQQHVRDHVDRQTDEVNNTSLAEEAASEFNIYEDNRDYEIPEEVFDLSLEVGNAWEKHNKKAASEDEETKESRFEEGKPADPTKNMSPEDAKKWKDHVDEDGSNIKKAGVSSMSVGEW